MATITVGSSGTTYTLAQFQSALDAAVDGDTITIKANEQVTGSFIARNKGVLSTGITITTDAPSGSLPAPGIRTSPSYAALMPKIKSSGGGANAMQFEASANGYTFKHVQFLHVPNGFNGILRIGANDGTQEFTSQQPYNITVDRCYFKGGPVCGQKHAVELHSGTCTVKNSYFEDIKTVGQDGGCFQGANGTGPYTITNNYLSGGTEPFILGGDDPRRRTLMNITASTTTSASITCSEAGHTLSELALGQEIALTVAGAPHGWVVTTISTITGSGASGSITFPAVSAAPTVGTNTAKAGVICTGLTFRFNYVRNDPLWLSNAVLLTPTGFVATPSTASGSLAAATYYYSVQARHLTECYSGDSANNGFSRRTAEAPGALLTVPGKVTLSWSSVPNAEQYIVWRGTSALTPTVFKIVTGATSLVDDGSVTWTAGTPHGPSELQSKNLLEIKACQNAQIDSNIFEYVGTHSANALGKALWIKSTNQDGLGPWTKSRNITIEKNIFRHVNGFLLVHGREVPSGATFAYPGTLDGLIVRNNLMYDSNQNWGTIIPSDTYAMTITSAHNCVIDHNTLINKTSGSFGGLMTTDSTDEHLIGFVCKNNMMRKEAFGIHDETGVEGTNALDAATSGGYTFTKNAIANAGSGLYGASNFYEDNATWESEFVTYAADGIGADFHIKGISAYHNAGLDGKDLGADIDLVLIATANVLTGTSDNASSGSAVGVALVLGVGSSSVVSTLDRRIKTSKHTGRVFAR